MATVRIYRFEVDLLDCLQAIGGIRAIVNGVRWMRKQIFQRQPKSPQINPPTNLKATVRLKTSVTWHIPPPTATIGLAPGRLTLPPLSSPTESDPPPTAKGDANE